MLRNSGKLTGIRMQCVVPGRDAAIMLTFSPIMLLPNALYFDRLYSPIMLLLFQHRMQNFHTESTLCCNKLTPEERKPRQKRIALAALA